jgi:hypothetical protein
VRPGGLRERAASAGPGRRAPIGLYILNETNALVHV